MKTIPTLTIDLIERLRNWGANIAGFQNEFSDPTSPEEVLEAIVAALENPNARLIGACIQVIRNLDDEIDWFTSMFKYKEYQRVVRRLGYILDRLELHHSMSLLLKPLDKDNFIPLSSDKFRTRDLAIEKDELMLKWGVVSPVDIVEEYVKEASYVES